MGRYGYTYRFIDIYSLWRNQWWCSPCMEFICNYNQHHCWFGWNSRVHHLWSEIRSGTDDTLKNLYKSDSRSCIHVLFRARIRLVGYAILSHSLRKCSSVNFQLNSYQKLVSCHSTAFASRIGCSHSPGNGLRSSCGRGRWPDYFEDAAFQNRHFCGMVARDYRVFVDDTVKDRLS